jgi:hypothetical protein
MVLKNQRQGVIINNYIYSYRDILKALLKYQALTVTKSKVINPLFIGSRLNSANFEDIIICYTDAIKILKSIKDYTKIFIFMAIIDGFSENQIADVMECSRQNINKHKHLFIRKIREVQTINI